LFEEFLPKAARQRGMSSSELRQLCFEAATRLHHEGEVRQLYEETVTQFIRADSASSDPRPFFKASMGQIDQMLAEVEQAGLLPMGAKRFRNVSDQWVVTRYEFEGVLVSTQFGISVGGRTLLYVNLQVWDEEGLLRYIQSLSHAFLDFSPGLVRFARNPTELAIGGRAYLPYCRQVGAWLTDHGAKLLDASAS
jgi:hypothetical protein